MGKILIFAGTTEGRTLAEHLCDCGRDVVVSVATEYGTEVIPQKQGLTVLQGRLGQPEMEQLLQREKWEAVIDATHPYAQEITRLLGQACEATDHTCLRLLREQEEYDENRAYYADTLTEALNFLDQQSGNILLTTGSKELEYCVSQISDISRIYARVLADEQTVASCKALGLRGKQIICMQGPFSAELNAAMLKQLQAKWLLTKDTGEIGGLPQKLEGAAMAGARTVIIRRPKEEGGYQLSELLELLQLPQIPEPMADSIPTVTFLGIGMGNLNTMTQEAMEACRQAEVILGAKRMVDALASFGKVTAALYRPEEITAYVKAHPEYRRIVLAFSGDIGFYSGTSSVSQCLEQAGYECRYICGISTVSYAAAKFGMSWQDMKLVSIHGRDQNVIAALREHSKVFVLASKADSIVSLAKTLCAYHMDQVRMHVGCQLSYPEERLITGSPKDFLTYQGEGIHAVILTHFQKHPGVFESLTDESFLRGKAPMTKEEIRSISLSKLALTKCAVVYDIGAGTGSVGIACARAVSDGRVYAIEKKPEALQLLEENKYHLGAYNLTIVPGTAPEALEPLEIPTHAFIGGSSGNLEEILHLLLQKNPDVRIVINAISLETLAEVTRILQQGIFQYAEVVQVNVSKARELGSYHLMMGQNPVYIVTLQQKKEAENE